MVQLVAVTLTIAKLTVIDIDFEYFYRNLEKYEKFAKNEKISRKMLEKIFYILEIY